MMKATKECRKAVELLGKAGECASALGLSYTTPDYHRFVSGYLVAELERTRAPELRYNLELLIRRTLVRASEYSV